MKLQYCTQPEHTNLLYRYQCLRQHHDGLDSFDPRHHKMFNLLQWQSGLFLHLGTCKAVLAESGEVWIECLHNAFVHDTALPQATV